MSAIAIGFVALAAVLHVTWNVLLKTGGDPLRTSAVGMVAAAAVAVPVAAVGWLATGTPAVPAEVVALAVVSGAVEVVFFVLLSAAYRRGDLSVVYPIARGTAPLLAVAAGVVLLGERLTAIGWLGVGLLLAGLLAIQRPWRYASRSFRGRGDAAVPFAVGTGVAIATYSALDRVAVQLVPPWLYAGLLWLVMAAGLSVVVRLRDARDARRTRKVGDARNAGDAQKAGDAQAGAAGAPIDPVRAAAGGILTLAAYMLVLAALATAPLTVVAPLRESAILLASGWGVLRLGESASPREAGTRLAAAVLVVAGAATLAIAA